MGDELGSGRSLAAERNGRAWWSWVLGLGVLAAIASFVVPGLLHRSSRLDLPSFAPSPMRVLPELQAADAVPAEPGEFAGCHLLLVTLDTTRADRLGCYGNDRIKTPTLDRLAREGVLFSSVTAPAPSTLPSHATMLTGLYPLHHGARVNVFYRLGDEHLTLAEVLAARGYSTAAFVSTHILRADFGTAQGFEVYDDKPQGAAGPGADALSEAQRPADLTTTAAIEWLRHRPEGRFFMWVHYYDPHYPWEPPQPYAEQYKHPYDGEIAFMDAELGRLLAALDETGQSDHTVIVAVGDHGESLGQHGEWTHGYLLYDSALHVPMIMRCGQRLGGGLCLDRPVSLVDIMPTVLTMLGVADQPETDGVDLTRPPVASRTMFVETNLGEIGLASLRAVCQGDLKYIHGPIPELFDVSDDPFEEHDLFAAKPQVSQAMRQQLAEFFGEELEELAPAAPAVALSPSELAALESLGYVGPAGGAGSTTRPAEPRPDPKEVIDLITLFDVARATSMKALIDRFEDAVRKHPRLSMGYSHLARAYMESGNLDQAEVTLRRGLEIDPQNPRLLYGLGKVKLGQDDPVAAITCFRRLLEVCPGHIEARLTAGALLNESGSFAEAADVLVPAFVILPGDDNIRDQTISALTGARRVDEARQLLQQAVRTDSKLDAVRESLFQLLMSQRRYAQALEVLREAVRDRPETLGFANNLAVLLSICPDPKVRNPVEAVEVAKRICELTGYRDPHHVLTLSAAHMAAGQRPEAVAAAEKALELATASGDEGLAATIRNRLKSFTAGTESATSSIPSP